MEAMAAPLIVVFHAHPYPRHSRACAALVAAIRDLPHVELRALYEMYPDFDIDVAAEQAAMERARLAVWLHPTYWYTAPALMKLWLEKVLVKGWAYGTGASALIGKDCLWVTTTGGDENAYSSAGRHHQPFGAFQPVMEQTARYCGMNWLEPFVVHGAHEVGEEALRAAGQRLREQLSSWERAVAR